jgi:hypothetical protein
MIMPGGTTTRGAFGILNGDSVTFWCDGANWWGL